MASESRARRVSFLTGTLHLVIFLELGIVSALILFTQNVGGVVSLWSTRFSSTAWEPAHMVESFASDFLDFDVAMDDAGNAVAVLEVDISGEIDTFYLLVP